MRLRPHRPRATHVAVAIGVLVAAIVGGALALREPEKPPPDVVAAPKSPALLGGYSEPPTAVPPPARTSSTTTTKTPVMDKASKLAQYERLKASGDPVDAKLAYNLAQRCIDDVWAISRVSKDLTEDQREIARQECGDLTMKPGVLEPTEQLALAKVAAEAGVHRAYIDLYRNHVKGSRTMPEGDETDAYMERVRQIALSTADPYALAEEEAKAEQRGDKAAQLSLFVAYRASLARDRGEPYDPVTDQPTQKLASALPAPIAKQSIDKGTQFVALNYRSHK